MDHYKKACDLLTKAEKAEQEYASTFIRLAEIHLSIWKTQQSRNQPPKGYGVTWNQGS